MNFIREYTVKKTGVVFTVQVEIDIEEVCKELAARAISNKLRKAATMQGALKCKVIEEKDTVK